MQTEEIILTVPSDVARRFRDATPEQRERAKEAVAQAVMSRDEQVRELERRMNQMAATARERGLTDARLEELLRGDG
ncbi:MAG: hypothetical protein AAGI91_15375 [Bacteroidota bacterium]